jgi:hypothetical protein
VAALLGTGRGVGADEDDFPAIRRKDVEMDRDEQGEVRAGALAGVVKAFGKAPRKKLCTFKRRIGYSTMSLCVPLRSVSVGISIGGDMLGSCRTPTKTSLDILSSQVGTNGICGRTRVVPIAYQHRKRTRAVFTSRLSE